jgi:superfamily I DNA and/or RNA helicase
MSRQKKALIVVGDSKLVDDRAPYKDKVTGLKDFYKLCKEEGMVI